MTTLSYSRFINFWRNLYQKFDKLSLGKQLGLILIAIIVIWQAVCFVQGAITARAMNYYCEKEAGIKLAEGTYFMEIPQAEYEKNCWKKKAESYPFYCRGSSDSKREWIKVNGSVERPRGIIFFRVPPKDTHLPDYIADDIGGLVKDTTNYMNANGKLIYTKTVLSTNSELMLGDYLGYYLFKKRDIDGMKAEICFNRKPEILKLLDKSGLFVNDK